MRALFALTLLASSTYAQEVVSSQIVQDDRYGPVEILELKGGTKTFKYQNFGQIKSISPEGAETVTHEGRCEVVWPTPNENLGDKYDRVTFFLDGAVEYSGKEAFSSLWSLPDGSSFRTWPKR